MKMTETFKEFDGIPSDEDIAKGPEEDVEVTGEPRYAIIPGKRFVVWDMAKRVEARSFKTLKAAEAFIDGSD
jgi:hypothetical protein